MIAQKILLCFIGLTAGSMVAAGVFAFITLIGVVTRLAARTKTVKHIMLYEDMVVLGGTLGNILTIFEWKIPVGVLLSLLIYIDCFFLSGSIFNNGSIFILFIKSKLNL